MENNALDTISDAFVVVPSFDTVYDIGIDGGTVSNRVHGRTSVRLSSISVVRDGSPEEGQRPYCTIDNGEWNVNVDIPFAEFLMGIAGILGIPVVPTNRSVITKEEAEEAQNAASAAGKAASDIGDVQ